MATVDQVLVRWTNFTGEPGYNIFYGQTLSQHLDSIRVFYDTIKQFLPTGTTCSILGSGVTLNTDNGQQVGDWSLTAPQPVVSDAAVSSVSGASGFVVDWRTTGRNWRGHRIRGRSFFVPAAGIVYTSGGTIAPTHANTINTAATGMMNVLTGHFGVWSRPVFVKGADGKPTDEIEHVGVFSSITSTNVPTTVAVLRSRRT